jgi:hypothetical protein
MCVLPLKNGVKPHRNGSNGTNGIHATHVTNGAETISGRNSPAHRPAGVAAAVHATGDLQIVTPI